MGKHTNWILTHDALDGINSQSLTYTILSPLQIISGFSFSLLCGTTSKRITEGFLTRMTARDLAHSTNQTIHENGFLPAYRTVCFA